MLTEEKEILLRKYISEGRTHRDIAKEFGVHYNTIGRWVKKMGLATAPAPESVGEELKLKRGDHLLTEKELLEVHGFDPKEFKLASGVSNEWTTPIKGEPFYNYQTKITVNPKTALDMTPEEFQERLLTLEPWDIQIGSVEGERNLFIPLSDMHFGHNSYHDYADIVDQLTSIIRSKEYRNIVISMHGDYFHVDNFMNTTEKGTRVDDVDFEQGIEDGYLFMTFLLTEALKNTPNVRLIYLPGNHAPSVDYMFANAIKRMFPQVTVDDAVEEYKAVQIDRLLLISHHGDKIKNFNKLLGVTVSQFGHLWSKATGRYMFTGHFHHEKSLSEAGITHYQLQSPSRPSTYDEKYGYITSEVGLQVFEFDQIQRRAIYYL